LTSQRDSKQKGMQRVRFLLYPLLCLGGFVFLISLLPVQVLSVGERGPLWKVSEGDTFTLRYTHSMYGVEVRENFRIGQEDFTLYQVDSSEAALEYFGIENSGPNNVRRTLQTFTVPGGSVGHHEILLKDRRIQLRSLGGEQDLITVRLVRMSLLEYLVHNLRR
jgi:hypothetical protein